MQERLGVTAFGMSTVRPVKYNVQWGHKSNHSSSMNVSDLLATYSKRMRSIQHKNKQLARALAASQLKTAQLEEAKKREQKIEKLALPRLKAWLENGMQCIHDATVNYSRAIFLLQDIMTPERDLTLIDDAYADEPSVRLDLRPPLRPKDRPLTNECGNITVISEENESVIMSRCTSPQVTALDPGVGQSPRLTMAMNVEHGEDKIPGRPVSALEPLTSSLEKLWPTFNAVEQVSQSTTIELNSTLITPAANVNSGRELKGHKMLALSSAGTGEADDFRVMEDSHSSSKQCSAPPRPRKSVGNASGSRSLGSRRSSVSAAGHGLRNSSIDEFPEPCSPQIDRSMSEGREASVDVASRSSACCLDEAFLNSPRFLPAQSSPVVPEETDVIREGEAHPHVPPSGASADMPLEANRAEQAPAVLQTSKAKPRPSTEPVSVSSAATADDSVPRYSSGRPARRSSLGKNYKEPSLSKKLPRR